MSQEPTTNSIVDLAIRACYAGERYLSAQERMLESAALGRRDPEAVQSVNSHMAEWGKLVREVTRRHRELRRQEMAGTGS